MIDGPSPQVWAELRTLRPSAEESFAVRPVYSDGAESSVLMAMDQAGALHLLIPVQSGPAAPEPPDLNGLKVRHRHLQIGQVLDLAASPSHERVFTPFCHEIIEAVLVQEREPWAAAAAIIRAWQSAWKPSRQAMDKATQVGLFGELVVLKLLMIPCLGRAAIHHWSGPDSERHDFVTERLHLEVKTTRRSRHEHEISRLDQLNVPPGRDLLVVSVLVEETVGGDLTVATQLDDIVDLLRADAAAVDEFMVKMSRMGWSDDMRRSGELIRFFLRDATIFEVDEHFPRLPDDFSPPSGVISVRYTISLANLPFLGVAEAIAKIQAVDPNSLV